MNKYTPRNWGEYTEKSVPEMFIEAGKPVLFKRVTDIREYTDRLNLPLLEDIAIEKFYSPLTNRFYSNPQEHRNMYEPVEVTGEAKLFLARSPKQALKDIHIEDVFVAGVHTLKQDYLIASMQEQNGLIKPHAIRITDILQYHVQ